MIAPVHRLTKKEIIGLAKQRCRHRHTYLAHYHCYMKEHPNKDEKVGFFDIESSNLAANFGIIFGYCIKDALSNKIYNRIVTKEELIKDLDKQVVKQCVKDISRFDKLITFYGTKFDLPFIRTRAAYWGIEFPEFGEINHIDVYYLIKSKFRLHSNRLENACKVILGETNKTHMDANHWIKALQGNKKSLDYILYHCKQDVLDLEKLYNKTMCYRKGDSKSI